MEDTYNGWANRETWEMNQRLKKIPQASYEMSDIASSSGERYERAQRLQAFVQEEFEGVATENVDWAELIANHEEDNDEW